jgi:transcriptional regulator
MYLPRRFAESDLAALDTLIARDAFVTLITLGEDGQPFASHLPVLYRRDGERIVLEGHWAKPNPQASRGDTALVIVHGPHAYVSPTWYAEPDKHVPTWNYAVAHLRGPIERYHDPAPLEAMVAKLAVKYESGIGSAWRFPQSAPGELGDLRGIVGFRIAVDEVAMKFKLNQNHPGENVAGAAAALAAMGGEAAEVASLMRERLAQRSPT